MAHNSRTHSDATWTNGGAEGYDLTPADLEDLDLKTFQGVNGDRGGAYAPSSPIIIGDASSPGAASPGMTVTGPTLVAFGGSITTQNQARYRIAQFPVFGPKHTSRSRKILTSCVQRQATHPFFWTTLPGGIQSIACTIQENLFTGARSLNQPSFILPLRVHDGATMSRATLTFRVPTVRTTGPVRLPQVRIVRVDANGDYVPLKKTDDGTGFVPVVKSASGGSWYNGGNAQTLVYECDQNNVIDSSQYIYKAQVIEEVGTDTPIDPKRCDALLVRGRLANVTVAVNPATDHVFITGPAPNIGSVEIPSTIDGVVLIEGYRILVWSQFSLTDPTRVAANGIWEVYAVGSGPSAILKARRSVDLSDPSQFTPGLLIGVEVGARFGQTMWELVSPTAQDNPNIYAGTNDDGTMTFDNSATIKFQRRKPTGNIYHSFVCEFTNIPDMRFQ